MSPVEPLRCKAVVFDLDGTICHGSSLLEGAGELVKTLSARSIAVLYCTNNSSRTRSDICCRLNAMGLPVSKTQIYTAAHATAHYIAAHNFRNVFCFGSKGLQEELRAVGVTVVSRPEEAVAVVIGLEPAVNYDHMCGLVPILGKDLQLIACNNDKFFPADGGNMRIGCGVYVKIVEEILEKKVDYIVGKPNVYMLNMLLTDHDLAPDDIVMIGDSIESDIAMAEAAGCRSILLSRQDNIPLGIMSFKSLRDVQKVLIDDL